MITQGRATVPDLRKKKRIEPEILSHFKQDLPDQIKQVPKVMLAAQGNGAINAVVTKGSQKGRVAYEAAPPP